MWVCMRVSTKCHHATILGHKRGQLNGAAATAMNPRDQGVRVQPCQSTPRQTLHSCSEMTEALANGRTPPFHAKRSRAMDPARPRLPHAMSQPIVNTHSGSGCQPCYNTSSSYMALNTHNGASCPTCHTPSDTFEWPRRVLTSVSHIDSLPAVNDDLEAQDSGECGPRLSPKNPSSPLTPAKTHCRCFEETSPMGVDKDEDDEVFLMGTPVGRKSHTARLSSSINEAHMIGEHPSYHQAITGAEADRRLKQFRSNHCYLTRYSKWHKCYVLSVYEYQIPPSDPVIEHFPIVVLKDGKLKIENKARTFEDIRLLLQHYEEHRIDPALRSIGEPYTEKQYIRVQTEEIKNGQPGADGNEGDERLQDRNPVNRREDQGERPERQPDHRRKCTIQ